MSGDSSSSENMAAALSPYEQWRLLLWMEAHPAVLEHDMTTEHGSGRTRPHASRRAPLAYAVGLAVGMVWVLLRRWW